jgi:hypothetical protein
MTGLGNLNSHYVRQFQMLREWSVKKDNLLFWRVPFQRNKSLVKAR